MFCVYSPIDYQVLERPLQNLSTHSTCHSPRGPQPRPLDINEIVLRISGFMFPVLSRKVTFLVAITSVRRVGELGALMTDPSFTMFPKDQVSLPLHPKFLSKVVSNFHFNQPINFLSKASHPAVSHIPFFNPPPPLWLCASIGVGRDPS